MSADAAPAAATTPSIAIPPAPNTAPTATGAGPRQGLLASMVAPVEPARPTFALDPAAAAQGPSQGGTDVPAGGVSSAAFHDTTTPADTKTDSTSREGAGKPKQGMIRALVLAAATRWAKGGGTANKRLDMHKARAQADQVKETRQVTVNRSPGTGGGTGPGKGSGAGGGRRSKGSGAGSVGGSANGAGGKSLDRKSSGGTKNSGSTGPNGTKNSGSTGPKNNTSPTKGPKNPSAPDKGGNTRGPSGASGFSGRGDTGRFGGGGSGGGKNTGGGRTDSATTPKPAKTKDTPESTPKHTAPAPKGSGKTGTGGGAAASGAKGSAGSTGKPGKDGKATPAPKGPSADGGTNTKDAPAGTRIPKQTTTNDKNTTGKNTGDTAKDTKSKPDLTKDQKPKDPTAKTSDTPDKPDPASKTPGDEKQPAGKAATADASGNPLATQPARETGYRDGARAGKAAAHVRAYRDGIKDGWADTLDAADHEKAQLNQAHADRKNSRKDQNMARGKVVEYDQGSGLHAISGDGSNGVRILIDGPNSEGLDRNPDRAQPVKVTGIDAKNLHLGDGASRTTISRGEVRSLKQFERRLESRLTTLQKTADTTKQLQAHAEGQAQQAQKLLEQAKGVKGGDKLATALSRLTEDAKKQATEAGEIHKRAVRSADACAAALTNVATRYGGMYQAVVDSPETIPAEFAYYQGA
ncbi:hypothetical protein OG473_39870 (plasmid) [Streptomyces anulatus]|uniref:hypothetical protein n=1 Tax=Streptomyces anulatus TaxID=1892 RepID=UPI00324F73FB